MTTESNNFPDNTALVLFLPDVLGSTKTVKGAHCGVPIHVADLPPKGPRVIVRAYLYQAPNDTVVLNLNGQLNIANGQTDTDASDTLINLPKRLLLPDIVNRLTYTVFRGSQNEGTSDPLEILYNAIRPGNEDTEPGPPHDHSRLELLLPDAIKNGVGPDFPVAGVQVCVRYPYCRAYDLIRLNCNGYDVYHTVTPSQAPAQGSDTPVTVCFTVTRADLEAAKDHPRFVFSFTVTDQVGNGPDTDSPWSAAHIVDVDLAGSRLPAALLREQLNDPGDDPHLIDLAKLRGKPLLLIILTSDSRFRLGYTINALYTATLSGQPDVVVRVSGTVEGDEFGQKKLCVLEVSNDKVLAGYAVKVTYDLFNGATLVGSSKTATASVVGGNTIEIPPPTLLAPAGNPVEPLSHPSGVQVQVVFAAASPGDQAQLFLINPLPGSPVFPVLSLAQFAAIFTLNADFLGQWHGKVPQLGWKLIRGGQVIAESLPLVLTVQAISSEDGRLPTPTVANQTGRELDVPPLSTSDRFKVARWSLQAYGQRVWLRYDGFLDNGTATEFVIWTGQPHNYQPEREFSTPLTAALIAWLRILKGGSNLTVNFRVNFDKVANAATAVTFPRRVYTVKALADEKPVITKVEDSNGEILEGGGTIETTVTLIGTGAVGQQVQIYNRSTAVGSPVDVDATGSWNTQLMGLRVADHSVTAKPLYGSGLPSKARTFTVAARLTIDTRQMNLNGISVKISNWPKTGRDSIGNTDMREPQGGKRPYTYHSSNDAVASTQERKVIGNRNGQATITVRDSLNQEVFYPVRVSNVYFLGVNETPMTASQARGWYQTLGNVTTAYHAIPDMERVYDIPPFSNGYWLVADPFPAHGCIYGYYAQYHKVGGGIRCAYDFEPASTWYLIPT
jgi:hypothetical protein